MRGIATSFEYRLHELPTVDGGMLVLPATPQVIASVIAQAEAAPDELSLIANVMVAPPLPFLPAEVHGKLIVMALICYAGDAAAGERAVIPAFGAYTGGLSIRDAAFAKIFRNAGLMAHVLGDNKLHAIAASRCH